MTFSIDKIISQLLSSSLPSASSISQIITLSTPLFSSSPNILTLSSPITIIGDLHGQFFDFLFILNSINFFSNSKCKILFLGDVVDRGYYSTETITLILALKIKYNDRVFIIRGNHESKSISSVYGFYDELRHRFNNVNINNENDKKERESLLLSPKFKFKNENSNSKNSKNETENLNSKNLNSLYKNNPSSSYNNSNNISSYNDNSSKNKEDYQEGISLYRKFTELFNLFPIAATIDSIHFCVHGGIPRPSTSSNNNSSINTSTVEITSLEEINSLYRFDEVPFTGEICDLLWSDPLPTFSNNKNGKNELWEHNSRGAGIGYGKELSKMFLRKNMLKEIFRSHQLVMEGFKNDWGLVNTVWSAPNYCYRCGNLGSIIKLGYNESESKEVVKFKDSEEQREPDELERFDVMRDV